MRLSPLQKVNKQFGDRKELINQLLPLVDRRDGDTDASVRSRLGGLSNGRLLRLWDVEQQLRERFGSREALVDKLVEARKAAGHTSIDAVRAKLSGYSKARLLDLTRQKLAPAPQKLSSEQRIKARRGKARARAVQAAGK